jgi:hypothetical protein
MKVFKIEMLVIDFNDLGKDGVKNEIECVNYSNDCIRPDVMSIEEREVEWSDDHPLNRFDARDAEYKRLFGEK